jgi:hypothetical protein
MLRSSCLATTQRKHDRSAFAGAWFACSVRNVWAHSMRFRHPSSSISDALVDAQPVCSALSPLGCDLSRHSRSLE